MGHWQRIIPKLVKFFIHGVGLLRNRHVMEVLYTVHPVEWILGDRLRTLFIILILKPEQNIVNRVLQCQLLLRLLHFLDLNLVLSHINFELEAIP
jgi:hypothetical protein